MHHSQRSPSHGTHVLRKRLITLVVGLSFVLGGAGLTMADPPDDGEAPSDVITDPPPVVLATPDTQALAPRALAHIASQYGIAVNQLQIAEATEAHLPLTSIDLAEFKVLSSDGRSFGVSFDVATEQVIDPQATMAHERQAHKAAHGVLEPALYNRLQRNAAERIPVAVWVALEDPGTLARGANPDFERLAAQVRAAQTPAAEAARGLGVAVALADHVPVFFADLNAGQIVRTALEIAADLCIYTNRNIEVEEL